MLRPATELFVNILAAVRDTVDAALTFWFAELARTLTVRFAVLTLLTLNSQVTPQVRGSPLLNEEKQICVFTNYHCTASACNRATSASMDSGGGRCKTPSGNSRSSASDDNRRTRDSAT